MNLIDPTSSPWKITYVVTGVTILPVTDPDAPAAATTSALAAPQVRMAANSALGGLPTQSKAQAVASAGELPAALSDKLKAAGLTTPGLIGTAHKAANETDATKKAGAQAALVQIDKVKAKTPSLAAFDSTRAIAVMQALSTDEKQKVEAYLAAQSKLARDQYEKDAAAARTKNP